jgi:hypothetical protein
MYARVVRWDGGDADTIRSTTQEINSRAASGPPEGVPSKGFLLLADPDGGRVLAISLFETEADRQQGDQALNAMSPPGDGMGDRGPVEMYDVAVDVRM